MPCIAGKERPTMEKELYEEPEMEILELREEDIILTSGENPCYDYYT